MTDASNPQGQRAVPRERVLKGARMVFDGGVIDCAVLDISALGARVATVNPTPVPETLTLHLNGGAIYQARRRWARGREIGFEFASDPTLNANTAATAWSIYEVLRNAAPDRALARLREERCFDDPALAQRADELERAFAALAAALRSRAARS